MDHHPSDCKIHVGVRSHQSQLTTSDAFAIQLLPVETLEIKCSCERVSKNTVDGSEIRGSPPGMYKTPVNNGINYQPQLVQLISSTNNLKSRFGFKNFFRLGVKILGTSSSIHFYNNNPQQTPGDLQGR